MRTISYIPMIKAKMPVAMLLTAMTTPTLKLPMEVKLCRNQSTGTRKTKTRQKLMASVSFVFPKPYNRV